jgi:hypothetical protein
MTPPVLLPAAVAVAAVALGLLLGLTPSGRTRLVGPLRTFALAAALTVVLSHLLPEAISVLGATGLLVFGATVAVPGWVRLVGRFLGAPEHHHHTGLGLGYLGLLVHHVGDGLGLGAYGNSEGHGSHVDVLIALAVHTVPLVAVVTFAFRSKSGTRGAVLASGGLALASVVGVAASGMVPPELVEKLSGWIAAGVSGLLVHVVTHDLDRDLPETDGARVVDLAVAAAGVAMTLATSAHHEMVRALPFSSVPVMFVMFTAPALLAAVGLATALGRVEHPLVRRWLDPLPAPAYGLDGFFAATLLGGVRFGLLFFLGLLLVTRAVALGGHRAPEPRDDTSWTDDALGRIATLAPWYVAGLFVASIIVWEAPRLGSLAPLLALAAVLFVALPSAMSASCAVLLAIALETAGLSASAALAFAVVATTALPEAPDGRTLTRARAAWTVVATLLVGLGIGLTKTDAITFAHGPPAWAAIASLALLVPPVVFVLFRASVRRLLLLLFPSHDSASHAEHEASSPG